MFHNFFTLTVMNAHPKAALEATERTLDMFNRMIKRWTIISIIAIVALLIFTEV